MSLTTEQVKKHIQSDDNWGTSRFHSSALERDIDEIYFVAFENEGNLGGDDQPPTNHWCLLLKIHETCFIYLDMVPARGSDSPGIIILDTMQSKVNQTIHEIISEVPKHIKVADFLSLLIERKRDRYIFSPIGEGCRYWIFTFAQDLAQAGIIPKHIEEQVQADLQLYWCSPCGTVARDMLKGGFY